MGQVFEDVAAERAVLAGIMEYGGDAFIDCDDLIDSEHFTDLTNQKLYRCAQEFFADSHQKKLDVPSLLSTANKLGFANFLEDIDEKRYFQTVLDLDVALPTVRTQAEKLFKLSITKQLDRKLVEARHHLERVTGDESLSEILGLVENPIFEFTTKLNEGAEEGPTHIALGGREWLEDLIANPRESIGIPSPFPRYNEAIGGGYRRGEVAIVGARRKTGKTIWCDNVCLHVAKELNIPVLNIDTEMNREQHLARIIAHMTNINSLAISKGKITSAQADDCRRAMDVLESIPYTYHCVVGRSFEEQVASMRRWSIKTVGVDSSGRRNDCLVVHDYLKMMDEASAGKFQEYEKLGYNMIAMHSMATRCDIPVLSMVQLNREGGIAASDRITWFCSSYSTLARKVEGEGDMGCLKLVVDASRNGEGSLDGDHINIHFDGATARMVEGKTRYELERERQVAKQGMIVEDDSDAEHTFTEDEFRTVPEQRRPKRTRKQAS